ncbi:hypothetical protein [Enteractinococcus coprophilus]|uniref:Addiction module component n=1 Tax=Enteractinococcus coprophilus TaxID=1027633 RepID=A0A543AGL2_9MICC|nr:hypothetical protein [Enteractinococcus coprophilus]TQL71715.1 hypothetical protein FB556_2210 [Enteractinococcus coprophilus]
MKWSAAEIEKALLALNDDERKAVLYSVLRNIDKTDTSDKGTDQAWHKELLRKLQDNHQGALIDALEEHAQLRSDMSSLRQWR